MVERQILFVTDFEGAVERGLALATAFASEHAATLVILHVVPFRHGDGLALLHRELDLRHERPWRRLQRLVPTDPGVPYRHVLELGDPEERIGAYLEKQPVDLVLVEARSRGLLDRVRRQSLDVRLRGRAPCPVLSYRGESAAAVDPGELQLAESVPATETIRTVLEARVDALCRWLRSRRDDVRALGESRSVRDAAASLARVSGVLSGRVGELLELQLEEHRRALGASGFELRLHDGRSVARRGWCAKPSQTLDRHHEQARREGAAISLPMDDDAGADTGAGIGHVIVASASVRIAGMPPALLTFCFDARRDFLRILAQPGPCASFETYAFDQDGVMLSNSRFPEQLRRIGLLPPEPGVQATRLIRVCDPGTNLLVGEPTPSAVRPLTRMARAAIAGEDGWDWDGYRDYRGVRVVGAWRWVAEHGFGVAAEMDHPGHRVAAVG
jgi:nucleotide-binding universal stress UspA family protein